MTNSTGEPCPPEPCQYCTGLSSQTRPNPNPGKPWPTELGVFTEEYFLTSWEWCQNMKVCAATIDWEKLAGRD